MFNGVKGKKIFLCSMESKGARSMGRYRESQRGRYRESQRGQKGPANGADTESPNGADTDSPNGADTDSPNGVKRGPLTGPIQRVPTGSKGAR